MPPREDPTVANLRRARGRLAASAVRRMEERLPWYRAMSAQDRSWVGLVAHAAVSAFIAWYREPTGTVQITADVFGTAPRELTRSITLRQTLEMVRTMVDAVEEQTDEIAAPGAEHRLREAVLRYSRDVAFAAAEVYARAAESRGAWDARLEALVVDGVLRSDDGDDLRSWAAALSWPEAARVVVVAGLTPNVTDSPDGSGETVEEVVAALRRGVRQGGGDLLIGVQGERLIVILGHDADPVGLVSGALAHLGAGPVVLGPVVDGLMAAGESARAALSGLAAARAWPGAPRPVAASDLLPERLLAGDPQARQALIDQIYRPLAEGPANLLETVWTYLELGGSLEGAARVLFVHPNTVRYRLRRVSDITRVDPTDPRGAFTLRVAITAARLGDDATGPTP
jgi:PucR C-terminal helix-turn-helix domain/GGDEF-like domain